MLAEQGQQRPQGTLLEDIVPALRTVTSNISESPDSLLTDVKHRRRKQIDKLWDSIGSNHNLSMFSGARGDVG